MSGPFAQRTGLDHLPLDGFGGGADVAADATDASAEVNVNGANDVANNSAAEAAEIAAVPDPQSPAGQAQIIAIIEKYQAKSAGTVEGSSATEQANGTQAAEGKSSSDDDDDDDDSGNDSSGDDALGGGSGSLMDVLQGLLGSGGSGMSGMSPFGQQGMSPFGQQGMGSSPFGDAYASQGAATPAADPFADPFGGASAGGVPATQAASYSPSADPFASAPSAGTGAATAASVDPFATVEAGGDNAEDKNDTDGETDENNGDDGGSGEAEAGGGVDIDAFSGADGAAVPGDPATATS